MMNHSKEIITRLPNFSIAFQQMASFVAIAKTRNSAEVLDEIVQQCFVILPQDPFSSARNILDAVNTLFGIMLAEKDVSLSIRRLLDKQSLIPLPGGQIGLSPAVKAQLETRISEAKSLEENVKKLWLSQVSVQSPALNSDKLWKSLRAYLTVAFRRHGIQMIILLDPTAEVAKEHVDSLSAALNSIIKQEFDSADFNDAHNAISSFFLEVRKDRNRAEYISQLADGAFSYFSLTVSPEICEKLRTKLSPLMLFLDTNFLFGILTLQSKSQFDVSTELVQSIKKFSLPFKLYYHDATQREATETISKIGRYLGRGKWPQRISRAAISRPEAFSSVELRYHQKNAEQAIEVEDFISPYRHWEILIKEYDIAIYRAATSDGRLRRRADLEMEYKDFLSRLSHEKEHDAIQHDMAVLETVRSLRSNAKNTLDAGAIIVTCDSYLCRFDWEGSRKEGKPGCTVLPSHLWQILRPFVTESENFDQAFAETFALPEFTLMKGGAMRAASRMLSILASYKDFPEEVATKMIADDLLLDELQDKKTSEEFHRVVDSALAKRVASLSNEIGTIKKELAEKINKEDALNKDLLAMQQKLGKTEKPQEDNTGVSKQREDQPIAVCDGPIKPAPEKTHTKRDGCIISFLVVIIFELSIHSVFRWVWLLDHANSYALQAGFSSVILLFILGLMVSSWRKFCWSIGTVSMAVTVVSLLGGPIQPH
ncbi:MAG: hypothetical protein ISS45_13035 [Candidatus Omnitrophica bacterium]|nr:hypothetical protein [Candidatus Omnitrophota bacterium]